MSLSGIILITTTICGIVTLIWYHIRRLHLYRNAAKFAGPPTLPIIGNAHYFVGTNHEDFLNKVNSIADSYQSPFRAWIGPGLYFVIYDPDNIKTILLSQNAIEKDHAYRFSHSWIGTGLLTAPADKWRVHRKLIQPTFNQKILESFVEIFAKQSEMLAKRMRKEVNRGEFDIFSYVRCCNFDIICETTMGVDLQTQIGTNSKYFEAAESQIQILFSRMHKLWMQSDFIFNFTKDGEKERENLKYLHGVSENVIKKKMSVYEKRISQVGIDNVAPRESPAKRRKAFLDFLIELSHEGKKLTNAELAEEVDTMLIAGSETSSMTVSFVLAILANYPEIQEKVYDELCEIYGDKVSSDSSPVTKDDIIRMEYLDRVIKETLRLFPPGALLARSLTDDIEIGERTMPKGSAILMIPFKVHRNEKYWPDPLKFDPDRFLPEQVAKRHSYCYLPFSTGPRGCVGPVFAMWAMKSIISTLLRRYVIKKDQFFNVSDIKVKTDFVLKPVETLTVKIVERNPAVETSPPNK